MSTDYNGWTNKPTWLVSLWWDNDDYLANTLRPEMVDAAKKDVDPDLRTEPHEQVINILAHAICVYATDPENGMMPDLGASLSADLMNWAIAHVNWREIAEHWLEDATV